jgi:N-sulfoglucosamine sulfohydrolase
MRLDAGIGMLLDKLEGSGKANDTLVIYLGDHGAQFSRGKTSVYEAGLRVPLIVSFPGRTKQGLVRDELVSTVDLLPTILDAVGVEGPENLPGRSLLPLCRGEEQRWREYLVGVTTGAAPVLYFPQTSIRDERYKLIVSPLRGRPNICADHYLNGRLSFFVAGVTREELDIAPEHIQRVYERYMNPPPMELYDLEKDPFEWHNLAEDPAHDAVRRRLLDALRRWQRETRDPLADEALLRRFTEEHDRAPEKDYRRDRSFRWEYLDYFWGYMH